jgi:peptide/nickel transport system ATP-binding protein
MTPLLSASRVSKHYVSGNALLARNRRVVRAVNDVSLQVFPGETLGLVGESGCGKSTLGRCLTRLYDITSGSITFDGADISRAGKQALRPIRAGLQMVFQDPYASLNPRRRVRDIIAEPLIVHKRGDRAEIRERVAGLIRDVGLRPEVLDRFPHEFSGGQRQRIGIARALALSPKLIVADEPVSALDVSVQAQIINLFMDLQAEHGLTYVFIAHDLGVVRQVATRVAVMYLGTIVESGPVDALFTRPAHPYTQALISAVPSANPAKIAARCRIRLDGDVPNPTNLPPGCPFHPRCAHATGKCRVERPALTPHGDSGLLACYHPQT